MLKYVCIGVIVICLGVVGLIAEPMTPEIEAQFNAQDSGYIYQQLAQEYLEKYTEAARIAAEGVNQKYQSEIEELTKRKLWVEPE